MLPLDVEVLGRGHEQIAFFQDPKTGRVAIVAIHSTVLGPALGGCRMNAYDSLESAFVDALKLSEGMTYKNSLAGLNLGGGKSVIIANRTLKAGRAELFESFGRFVTSLGGRYITAEDSGTSVADMNDILKTSSFVAGRDKSVGGGGDPSPYTARGVFAGMRACLERSFGSDNFTGRHVAVQGVGHVGRYLVELLAEAGAKITVSDSRPEVLEEVSRTFKTATAEPEKILFVECDVLSPCAMGGAINAKSAPQVKAKIIAGAANNQLSSPNVEKELTARSVLYAPDFAINAGGVILCADELEPGGFTESRVLERVGRIYRTVGRILDEAKSTGELPGAVALKFARERIEQVRRKTR